MDYVTKMQMFERVRRMTQCSRNVILNMTRIMDFEMTRLFAVENNPRMTFNTYGHGVYWFNIHCSVLGKLQREGLINKYGTIFNQYLYEVSELLMNFTLDEYQKYVNNYNFYKNNLDIIETIFEEQKISDEEQSIWIDHFYTPVQKHHFNEKKKKEKECRQSFNIGDVVAFFTKNKKAYSRSVLGKIVKLNPVKAKISVKTGIFGDTEQLWVCEYSRLRLRNPALYAA